MATMSEDFKEIVNSLPTATLEQLDSVGYRVETQHMFAVIGRSDPAVIKTLADLLRAINHEFFKRGIAIRKQDRK